MSADNRKQQLRSILAGKSTEELEELLTLDFTEDTDVQPDVDYITTILEVIEERETNREEKQLKTEAAWKDFQEYYQLRKQEELETDNAGESSHDHHRKTEYGQKPRKYGRVFRNGLIAAALILILCGTAFGWNIFQAIAEWTAETFHFCTGQEQDETVPTDPFEHLRVAVSAKTDIPAVPTWAPEGTKGTVNLKVEKRNDRCWINGAYSVEGREYTIQIVIHDLLPENYLGAYQKGVEIKEEYVSNTITHYIVGNNDNLSAMWTNGNVEGHIQGTLTLEELRQMIDSIYKE